MSLFCEHGRPLWARCEQCEPAPSPPPEMPEMPEGWEYVAEHSIFVFTSRGQVRHMLPLTRMRELLATQGLTIVPAAEATKPSISWDQLRDDPCSNCGGYSRKSTAGCDHCDHEEK